MIRTLFTAFALASVCACAGPTEGDSNLLGPDAGGGSIADGGGDGGSDAGGDAGADAGPDAGCVAQSLSGLATADNCPGGGSAFAEISVAAPPGCGVTISFTSNNSPCLGAASGGTRNAFDGGCAGLAGYSCTSPSLPGTLTCVYNAASCTIRICDGGTCAP